MKRDIELSRKILIAVEESDAPLSTRALATPLEEPEVILAYHVLLLKEAGFVVAAVAMNTRTRSGGAESALVHRLTHDGHEFLDTVRSDTTWKKLKGYVSSKGLEVTVGSLVKAVPGFIAAALEG